MPCKKEKKNQKTIIHYSCPKDNYVTFQLCHLSFVFCTAGRVDFSNIMQFDTIGADKTPQFFYVYMKPRSAVIKY